MGRVIYLTGSPASGKSTLCQRLAESVSGLGVYSYSKLLRDRVNRRTASIVEEDTIRRESAALVTREDVDAIDQWLIEEVRSKRATQHVVVDSHAVTKEQYGFRITAFSLEQLKLLAPDVIVCLYLDADITKSRIVANAAGRPLPADFELALHTELQASLAAHYALILGKPCYLLDSSVGLEELTSEVIRIGEID